MLFRKIPRVAESITADQIMARRFAENSVTCERDALNKPSKNVRTPCPELTFWTRLIFFY